MSAPNVQVPAKLFLQLARLYFEQTQDALLKGDFLTVRLLEQRAYRKLKEAKPK